MDENEEKNQKKKEKNSLLAGVRRSANNRIYIPLRTGDRTQAQAKLARTPMLHHMARKPEMARVWLVKRLT